MTNALLTKKGYSMTVDSPGKIWIYDSQDESKYRWYASPFNLKNDAVHITREHFSATAEIRDM